MSEQTIKSKITVPELAEIIVTCDDAQDAQLRAFNQSRPGSHLYPVLGYYHGERVHLSFPASAGAILDIGKIESATKADNQKNIDNVWNRKPNMEHANAVAEYVSDAVSSNSKYILPNTIMAGYRGVSAYVWEARGVLMGYIVVDANAKLPVTDGQHRYLALSKIKRDAPDDTWPLVEQEQYLVTLTLETDIKQAHQDFVDVGKTKPIEASVIKTWDQKDPHSRITKRLSEESDLFRDRIDVLSNSIGRNTDIALTMSQLSLVMGELLYGTSEKAKMNVFSRALKSAHAFEEALHNATRFFDCFAKANDAWSNCVTPGNDLDFFELRQQRLDFSSTGLQAICRAAHVILTDANLGEADASRLIADIAKLDYKRRDGEGLVNDRTPFYGNILSPVDGGILNKRSTIDAGSQAILSRIGYDESKRSKRQTICVPGSPPIIPEALQIVEEESLQR